MPSAVGLHSCRPPPPSRGTHLARGLENLCSAWEGQTSKEPPSAKQTSLKGKQLLSTRRAQKVDITTKTWRGTHKTARM